MMSRQRSLAPIGIALTVLVLVLIGRASTPSQYARSTPTESGESKGASAVVRQPLHPVAPRSAALALETDEDGTNLDPILMSVDLTRPHWQYQTRLVSRKSRDRLWEKEENAALAACAMGLEEAYRDGESEEEPHLWERLRDLITSCSRECRQRCALYESFTLGEDSAATDLEGRLAALLDASKGADEVARAIANAEITQQPIPRPPPQALVEWAGRVSTADEDIVLGTAVSVLLWSGAGDRVGPLLDALAGQVALSCDKDPTCWLIQNVAEAQARHHVARGGVVPPSDPLVGLLSTARKCVEGSALPHQDMKLKLVCDSGTYLATRHFPSAARDIAQCISRAHSACILGRPVELTYIIVPIF